MKKAGDVLSNYLEQFGIKDDKNYAGLFSAWKAIAGPEFQAHSRLRDINKGILVIEVDHPGWMQKIMYSQKFILQKVKKSFPQLGVDQLAFKLVDKFETPLGKKIQVVEPEIEDDPEDSSIQDEINGKMDIISGSNMDSAFIESLQSLKKAMQSNPKLKSPKKPSN